MIVSPNDFPLTRKVNYLNTAGVGLTPAPVVCEMQEFAAKDLSNPPFEEGYLQALEMVEETRKVFADFIDCSPTELTFQSNTSMGISLVSEIIPWKRGDEVLVDDLQFPSDIYPWISLATRGVKLKIIKSHLGRVDAANYEKALGRRTKLIAVGLVSYANGFTHDVVTLGELAKEHDAYFLVDATQGAGYLDTDVRKCQADFLVTSNYKWLISTFGAAELYMQKDLVQEAQSPHVGWLSSKLYRDPSWPSRPFRKVNLNHYEPVPDARKFEPGNLDYLSIFCLAKSLRYIRKVGFRKIQNETRKLHEQLIDGLQALNVDLLTPAHNQHWSAIVFCRIPGIKGIRLAQLLRRKKIHVTPRVFFNCDGIRVSPYFYNSAEDIDRLLEEIKRIRASLK